MAKTDRTILISNDQQFGQIADPNKLETQITHAFDKIDENDNEFIAHKKQVDPTSADTVRDKHVSNNDLKGLQDQITTNLNDLTTHKKQVDPTSSDTTRDKHVANNDLKTLQDQITTNDTASVNRDNTHKNASVLDHPDQSVTTEKLKDYSVTGVKIANGAVSRNQLDPTLFEQTANAAKFQEIDAQLAEIAIDLSKYCTLDGVADDTDGLITAVSFIQQEKISNGVKYGLFLPPNKIMRITRPVSCRDIQFINFEGNVNCDFSGTGLDIGGNAQALLSSKIYIKSIYAPAGAIALRVIGAKEHEINVRYASYMQLYADGNDTTASSSAYSQYHLGRIENLELIGVNGGWINENTFYCNRLKKILIDGDYAHNNNTFYRGCMEGAPTNLTINKGDANRFIDFRFEGGPITITFGSTTHHNVITQQWVSSLSRGSKVFDRSSVIVTDNGNKNIVQFSHSSLFEEETLFVLDGNTKMIGDATECSPNHNFHYPGFDKVSIRSFNDIFDTGIIPAPKNLVIGLNSGESLYRPYIYCFDSNKQPITTNPSYALIEGTTLQYNSGGYYYTDFNLSNMEIVLKNIPNVAYVRIKFHKYDSGWSTARVWMRRLKGVISHDFVRQRKRSFAVTAPITKGFVGLGEIVPKTTGGYFQCNFSLETSLSASALSGATTISVASATGVAVNDIVGVLLDDRSTHWTTVASVTGTTIGLTTGLLSSASATLTVGFNRWV